MGSGKMIIIFKGIINLSRVVNPISKVICRGDAWKEQCPMRAQDPHDRDGRRPSRRRRFQPACENLELRALLTTIAPNLPGKHYPAPNVQQFVPLLYPPGTPQPTAAEVKRESFVAKGYGRYTDRARTVRHSDAHHPRLRQADDQQYLPENALSIRGLRAHRPDAGRRRDHKPGGRQLSAKLDRPHSCT